VFKRIERTFVDILDRIARNRTEPVADDIAYRNDTL
jgi:hypothetical protein